MDPDTPDVPDPGESTPAGELSEIGPGDTTGTETLARYVYQCKVAVQRWLQTLGQPEMTQIVCEFVDDITTVTDVEILFAQVKTRDRGAWTAAKVFESGGGLDALVRSYNLARAAGCSDSVRLELVLEGPEGGRADTRTFFADPKMAIESQRTALLNLGLEAYDLDDFLSRLTITTQYHARQSIDGVTLQMLMAIAPGHSATIETLYAKLLDRAIAAHLGLADQCNPAIPLVLQPRDPSAPHEPVSQHALTRAELLALLPPAPLLAAEQLKLLEAANEGALAMTRFEFKLRVAGASDATVERAKERRAKTTATLSARPAIAEQVDDALVDLTSRLLEHAHAVAADIAATTASPAAAHTPGEVIYARLVQQLPQLAALDTHGIFGGDGAQVLGLLCEVSDQCRFMWTSA